MLAEIQPTCGWSRRSWRLLAAIALAPLLFAGWWGRHYPKVASRPRRRHPALLFRRLARPDRVVRTAASTSASSASSAPCSWSLAASTSTSRAKPPRVANTFFPAHWRPGIQRSGDHRCIHAAHPPLAPHERHRLSAHQVVFFIFIVSNVGGSLTPVGDPPLFLGYLQGVPFWWVVENCWPVAARRRRSCSPHVLFCGPPELPRSPAEVRALEAAGEQWRFQGLSNMFFLGVILGAVFVNHPPSCAKP